MQTGPDSKLTLPVFGLKAGDSVDIVATPSSDDPNETGENEPLVVQEVLGSSVVQSYTIPGYGFSTPLRFTVTGTGGALFQAWINGYDDDEQATLFVGINKKTNISLEAKQDAAFLARAYANEALTKNDRLILGVCPSLPPQGRLACGLLSAGSYLLTALSHYYPG